MKRLEGKVAVITGSTRGFGRAIAAAYLREGARVVISGRSEVGARTTAKSLDPEGARTLALACDVSDHEAVRSLARATVEKFGRFDLWVNNAGCSAPYGPTAQIPMEMFANVLKTNILGSYYGTHVALQAFIPERRGKIINILGRGDSGAVKLQAAYSTSKYWLKAFTAIVAKEHRDDGVGIFGFNPGLMKTEILSDVQAIEGYETELKPLETVVAMWANPPEVPAERMVWIASSATDGMTGWMGAQLGAGRMLSGALREGMRRLTGGKSGPFVVKATAVKSALGR